MALANLGHSLVSWFSKKQNSVALSTAEVEYVAAESCCAQLLWMKQQMEDYDLYFDHIPIKCDNTSAINLSKNPIQHLYYESQLRLNFKSISRYL